jgi:hypothetical protein
VLDAMKGNRYNLQKLENLTGRRKKDFNQRWYKLRGGKDPYQTINDLVMFNELFDPWDDAEVVNIFDEMLQRNYSENMELITAGYTFNPEIFGAKKLKLGDVYLHKKYGNDFHVIKKIWPGEAFKFDKYTSYGRLYGSLQSPLSELKNNRKATKEELQDFKDAVLDYEQDSGIYGMDKKKNNVLGLAILGLSILALKNY